MVEVAEWLRPDVLGSDDAASRCATAGHLPDGVYPQTVHSGINFGDNFWRLRSKFVDKAVVARMARP
jgi:hypothetical protein